jgi:hypothetical protein
MPLILTPSAASICLDWDNNFNILQGALTNAQINQQGLITLTRVDGATFDNPIPWFTNMIKTGLTFSLQASPNANLLDYTLGTYQINAQPYTIAAGGTIVLSAGHATFSRVDVVYLTTSNTIVYLAGTASANPVAPTVPANTLIAVYIGVNALASGLGGYTLVNVNLSGGTTPLSPGVLINQTLRWNGTAWVPNSGMLANGLKVSIAGISGFGTMDAITKLQVGGAIMIEDLGAPFPVTDKLYNVGGSLYWNGNILGYTGTVVGSHLRWNGSTFAEETQFLTTTLGGAAWLSSFTNTDGAGVLTKTDLGRSFVTTNRGSTMYVNDTLNLTQAYIDLSVATGLTPEIRLVVEDNNIGSQTKYFQDTNEIRLSNFDGATTAEIEITPTHTKITGGKGVTQRNTAVNTAVTASDYMIVATVRPLTITLPAAPYNGEEHVIKAITATVPSPITINGNGKNIDAAATATIITNYGSRTLVFNSSLNIWLNI